MSEVKVSSYRAPEGSKPAGFEAAAEIAKADWGRREQDRNDLIILPLEQIGNRYQGILAIDQVKIYKFQYDRLSGLSLIAE